MPRDVQTLSVRELPAGGDVDRNPRLPPINSSRLIILIHGYNNTLEAATQSYEKFLTQERPGLLLPDGEIINFFWPGDMDWGSTIVDAASYALEIQPARDSAQVLGKFLVGIVAPGGWPLEVTLICHSLGNRVALELMNFLPPNYSPILNIEAGCMMAAAVPVPFVEDGGWLRFSASQIRRTLVLYSGSDIALAWGFPPGETLAGEGFFPSAVGHTGEPGLSLWKAVAQMKGYGHSDYWPGSDAFKSIVSFLGAPVRPNPPESGIEARPGIEPRTTPSRIMNSRSLSRRNL